MRGRIILIFLGVFFFVSNLLLDAQGFNYVGTSVVGTNPILAVAVDANGDGKPDIVTVSGITNLLTVLTNDGRGGLVFETTLKAGLTGYYANSISAADVNGDGRPDLVCSLTTGNPRYIGRIFFMTNDGAGNFISGTYYATGTNPVSNVVADVNGDGMVDLITANNGSFVNNHTVSVLTNNGAGIYVSNVTINVGSGPNCLVVADVNRDGRPDLITANFYDSTLTILTNNGKGGFKLSASPLVGPNPLGLVAADANNDGNVDLITANSANNTLSVLTNDGTGKFFIASTPTVGLTPYSLTAADINGDGFVDLICPDANTNALTVLTNDGAGNFATAYTLAVGPAPFAVTAADISGDGRLDLINVNTLSNTISIFTNAMSFLPRLAVKHSGHNSVVTWAASWSGWAGWVLQQNDDLATQHWSAYQGTTWNDGTTSGITNTSSVGSSFFRLVHP